MSYIAVRTHTVYTDKVFSTDCTQNARMTVSTLLVDQPSWTIIGFMAFEEVDRSVAATEIAWCRSHSSQRSPSFFAFRFGSRAGIAFACGRIQIESRLTNTTRDIGVTLSTIRYGLAWAFRTIGARAAPWF